MCGNVHISDIFCQTFCQFLTTLKPITFLEENKYFNSSWHFCFLTMTEGFWKLPWYLCRYISKISETFSKCMRDVQSFLAHLCPDFQACYSCSRLNSCTFYILERTHIPDVLALIQLKSGINVSSEHANYLTLSAKVRLRRWELSSLQWM